MKPSRRTLRRSSLTVGSTVLLTTLVIFEPTRLADMIIASVGLVLVLAGLYDTRKAEDATLSKVDNEREALEGTHDCVPENEPLPRRNSFDVDDG